MKQSSKTIILKFETTFLFDEKLNETNDMRDIKMIICITLKSLSSNKTQIKKFDYFAINSIAIDILKKIRISKFI